MKLMSSIRTIFARSVRPSEQLIRIALWLLIIYLSYLLTGWYVTRDDTYLQLPDVTSPIARLFPTATPTNTPTMTPYPTYPPPTPTPTPSLIDPTVLHDDLYLSYIHHDHTAKTSTFTEIDFLTNTKVDHELPYILNLPKCPGGSDYESNHYYKVSPNGKYILEVCFGRLAFAEISTGKSIQFQTIYTAKELSDSIQKTNSTEIIKSRSVFFDRNSGIYFVVSVGTDGGGGSLYEDFYLFDPIGKSASKIHKGHGSIVAVDTKHNKVYTQSVMHDGHENGPTYVFTPYLNDQFYIEPFFFNEFTVPIYDTDNAKAYYVKGVTYAPTPTPTDPAPFSRIYEYDLIRHTEQTIFEDQLAKESNTQKEIRIIGLRPITVANGSLYFANPHDDRYRYESSSLSKNIFYKLDLATWTTIDVPIDCMGNKVTSAGYTLCDKEILVNVKTGTKIQLSKTPLDIVAFESGRRLTGGKDMYGLEPINPASTASDPRVAFDIPKVMAQVDDSEVKSVKRVTCDKDLSYFDPTQKELVYRSSARSPVPPTPTPSVRSRLGEEFISRRAYPQIYDVVQKLSQKEKLGTDSFFRFCKIEGGVDFVLFGNNDSLGNTWKRVDLPLTDPYTAKETSIKLNQVFESSTIVYSDSDRYILYSQGGDVSLFRRLELIDPQTRSQRRFFSCEHYKQDDSEFMCDYSRTPCKDIYKGSAENINDVAFHTDCTVYRTVPWIEVRESLK